MSLFAIKEQHFNKILGVNIVLLAITGLIFTAEKDFSIIRLDIALINIYAGVHIFTRKEVISKTSTFSQPHWIIVLICNGILFKLSQPTAAWGISLTLLFTFGVVFTIISFTYLGRNFSIRPSVRGLSSHGTYKIVRHPCYLGELIMTLACVVASQNYYSILVFIILILFQVWRIKEEETVLQTLPAYLSFSKKTRWRLLPLVW